MLIDSTSRGFIRAAMLKQATFYENAARNHADTRTKFNFEALAREHREIAARLYAEQ